MNNFPLKYNGNNLKNVITAFWIFIGMNILFLFYEISDLQLINQSETFYEYAVSIQDRIPLILISTILVLIIGLILMVLFMVWFYRAYFNLSLRTETEKTAGWAIGTWFIPVYWWFACFGMLQEIWTKKQLYKSEKEEIPNTLSVYWSIFILSNVLGGVSNLISNSEDLTSLKVGLMVSIGSTILGIVSAIMAIKIYKKIGEFEESFYNNSHTSIENIADHLIED